MTFETLIELFEIATAPWSPGPWTRAAKPTPASIDRIQSDLGIRIPDDFVQLAAACPSYGAWLAGIGDDFDSASHILRLNSFFHRTSPDDEEANSTPLPSHFVMLNHGYDGDCDCWDTRVLAPSGEHPIVYVCRAGELAETPNAPFQSFRAYAERFALHHARSGPDKTRRRRAERLIQEQAIAAPQPLVNRYICIPSPKKSGTSPPAWFVRLLQRVLPAANPDFEHLYDEVVMWHVEIKEATGEPLREVGLNADQHVLVIGPWRGNYGVIVDSGGTFVSSEYQQISPAQFEQEWKTLASPTAPLP